MWQGCHAEGVSIQWMMAVRIDDDTPAIAIERLHYLSADGLASLDEPERPLASLTISSPCEATVDAYAVAMEVFEGLRADTTESEESRHYRAILAGPRPPVRRRPPLWMVIEQPFRES
jgi:hypothetical protein